MNRIRIVGVTSLTVMALASATLPAYAVKDSGVLFRGCPSSQFGKTTFLQIGQGNSWAPGDWSTDPQFNLDPPAG